MIFQNNRFIHKLKKRFVRPNSPQVPPITPWDALVEMMYDTQLNAFGDKVIRVVYSTDRTMRYVILKDEKGLYTYQLEAIYQFDKEEWKYIFSEKHTLPAMWEPFHGALGSSFFANEQELLREMETEPEYKRYLT